MTAGVQETFGDRLKHYRRAAGFTQEALADSSGVSVRTISDLERGLYMRPHRETVQRLVEAIGLSAEEQSALEHAIGQRRRPCPSASSASVLRRPHRTIPNNLPDEPTPFIGRDHEVVAVCELLKRPDVRLLTLTGTGGAGKTRLAVRAGATLLSSFPDGVLLVPLAPLDDYTLVLSAIAETLGVQGGSEPLCDLLIRHLRDKRLLLIVDNFEHVLEAGPSVASLLDACHTLTFLVTSRSVLRLRREHIYEVPPLTVPDPRRVGNIDDLCRYEAVALFMERARAVKPDFALTPDNATTIAHICSALDGLPLALELAAGRIRMFSPQALLDRLSRRLHILTGGAEDAPHRHHTLRKTIGWSYELLDPGEQTLFARLSVFSGGFTLEAAETVCNGDGDLGVDLLYGMTSLVEKSLLRQRPEPGNEAGFVMLETIREYAAEELTDGDTAERLRRLHAHYYLRMAEDGCSDPRQADWMNRLETDHDNLRAALTWFLDHDEMEPASRLAEVMGGLWNQHAHLVEARP